MCDQKAVVKENNLQFIERLAEKLGATVNAEYIYGEPVERGEVTVIPVARASYGLGGGSGSRTDAGRGGGGGGGLNLAPVGYIEIKNGETRFCPIRDWSITLPMILTAAPLILTVLLGVRRLLKRK